MWLIAVQVYIGGWEWQCCWPWQQVQLWVFCWFRAFHICVLVFGNFCLDWSRRCRGYRSLWQWVGFPVDGVNGLLWWSVSRSLDGKDWEGKSVASCFQRFPLQFQARAFVAGMGSVLLMLYNTPFLLWTLSDAAGWSSFDTEYCVKG